MLSTGHLGLHYYSGACLSPDTSSGLQLRCPISVFQDPVSVSGPKANSKSPDQVSDPTEDKPTSKSRAWVPVGCNENLTGHTGFHRSGASVDTGRALGSPSGGLRRRGEGAECTDAHHPLITFKRPPGAAKLMAPGILFL